MSVYRLTSAQWEYIRLLLLVRPRLRGCLPADNRQTLEAILHVLTTGCPWSELPRSLGSYVTAWRRFRKWGADGTFARIWPYLRAEFEHAEKIDRIFSSREGAWSVSRRRLPNRFTGGSGYEPDADLGTSRRRPPHSGKFYSSDGVRHIGGIDKPEGVDAFHTTFISLKQLRCTYADCAYNIFVPTW